MIKLSKEVRDCVLNDMTWKVDLPALLKEIHNIPGSPYTITFNILKELLVVLVTRAIEIDDPALNIIMMKLALYDGAHTEEGRKKVEALQDLIRKADEGK